MSIKSTHRFMAQVATIYPIRFNRLSVGVVGMAAAGVLATCAVAAAPKPEKVAASAQTALAKGKVEKAIALAEQAVALEPRKADWRVVLGDSYLRAGRFVSARQAYEDALQLGNDKGRTALALALMQISQGQYAQASDTLSAYRDAIPASDYGLALALSGQTGQGVAVLADALRQGDNSPKIRQNLAYAFALDGKWPMARAMVEQDLPADKVDDRLSQWALAGQPEDTQKRVAMLLGTPLRGDSGEPVALALATAPAVPGVAPKALAVAETHAAAPMLARAAATELPPLASEPTAPVVDVSGRSADAGAPAAAPAIIDGNADAPAVLHNIKVQSAAEPAPAPAALALARVPTVRRSVARQAVAPAPVVAATVVRHVQVARAPASRAKQTIAPVYASTGNVAVQLGAFATQDGAQRALRHYAARHMALGGHKLGMVKVQVGNKTYWRVLATGFANGHGTRSASAACHSVTLGGGTCFVRADLSRFQPSQPVGFARNAAKPAPHNAVAPGLARRK
ncbi:tetratricopeptide repeat protein [Novosphingobium sp.]|uniref:SPOR domain-containing protein n=1 Tax=Novosphingobium sp. TaxID=1874826 RepID=UPI0025DA9AFE|nr:tetratricopeptide repeat protein [Novosphingobium sp.]